MQQFDDLFYLPINILLGIRAITELMFACVFVAAYIKTKWEIEYHHRNGIMVWIKNVCLATSFKFIIVSTLSINGIFRLTVQNYPSVTTFVLLVLNIFAALWLGFALYNLVRHIMIEEDHDDRNNLQDFQKTKKGTEDNLSGNDGGKF